MIHQLWFNYRRRRSMGSKGRQKAGPPSYIWMEMWPRQMPSEPTKPPVCPDTCEASLISQPTWPSPSVNSVGLCIHPQTPHFAFNLLSFTRGHLCIQLLIRHLYWSIGGFWLCIFEIQRLSHCAPARPLPAQTLSTLVITRGWFSVLPESGSSQNARLISSIEVWFSVLLIFGQHTHARPGWGWNASC